MNSPITNTHQVDELIDKPEVARMCGVKVRAVDSWRTVAPCAAAALREDCRAHPVPPKRRSGLH